jgi:hypothetical protein
MPLPGAAHEFKVNRRVLDVPMQYFRRDGKPLTTVWFE